LLETCAVLESERLYHEIIKEANEELAVEVTTKVNRAQCPLRFRSYKSVLSEKKNCKEVCSLRTGSQRVPRRHQTALGSLRSP